jgi:NADH:ubiquinone oxidoreductase subunit F (NADH-binding)
VFENRSTALPATVVVNGAEGEPGSFKDRALLRRNPYRVVEGALVAAHAVGADRVIVALKASFATERSRVDDAVASVAAAGWADGMELTVFAGPGEYLYGEETALLEVIDGRAPFPRVAPPFRHGVDEVSVDPEPASAGQVVMADPGGPTVAPPTLVNNVETLANVPGILLHGPAWFGEVGTQQSPGTVVCTVTGATRRHDVGEFAMGTPLREVIETLGGGVGAGRRLVAAMSGVANPLVPAEAIDSPVSYEGMEAIGAGLGAAGFIVFDDTVDLVAVAHGAARFLAVESCGQCTPCKQDGLAIAERMDALRRGEGEADDLAEVQARLATVADGARCSLAEQQQRVIGSVLTGFDDQVQARASGPSAPVEPYLVAPIVELADGRAQLDTDHADKQPDWTLGAEDSGASPADRIDERREG